MALSSSQHTQQLVKGLLWLLEWSHFPALRVKVLNVL